MSQRLPSSPYYKIRADLGRNVVGGVACPLGVVFPHELAVEIREGYESRFLLGDDQFDDQCEYRIVLSSERMCTASRAFMKALLPEHAFGLYEEFSYDAFREKDVYRSHVPVALERILQAWDTYGQFFIEDGKSGFGGVAEEPNIEIFLEDHSTLYVNCGLELRERVEDLIEGLGIPEMTELRWVDNYEHQHRDILEPEINGVSIMDDLDIKFSVIESLGMVIANRDEGRPSIVPTPFWCYVELDLSFVDSVRQNVGFMSFGLCAEDYDDAIKVVTACVMERFPSALVVRTHQCYRMAKEDIGEQIAPADRSLLGKRGIWYRSQPELWA